MNINVIQEFKEKQEWGNKQAQGLPIAKQKYKK
jgi:hypothetical protein